MGSPSWNNLINNSYDSSMISDARVLELGIFQVPIRVLKFSKESLTLYGSMIIAVAYT